MASPVKRPYAQSQAPGGVAKDSPLTPPETQSAPQLFRPVPIRPSTADCAKRPPTPPQGGHYLPQPEVFTTGEKLEIVGKKV